MVTMNDALLPKLLAVLAYTILAVVLAGGTGADWLTIVFIVISTAVTTYILRPSRPETVGEDEAALAAAAPTDLLGMAGFTRILDGLSDPMLVVDQGRIVLANCSARRLLGGHIVGSDVRIAIRHPAAAERFADKNPIIEPITIDIVGLGSRDQRWSMQIIPIDTDEGHQRLLVHLVDKSAKLAAERARVDFVANASHELRTPLAAILGFVETLSDPDVGNDAATRARFLGIVEGEARRMQQLVDDLMSLSRIEADKHSLPDTPVDMAALAREAVETLKVSRGARGADLHLVIKDNVPPVRGDRAQMSQLLHNLIDNAAKYGRPGTPVDITLAPYGAGMLKLRVSDQGEGIAEEHLPRLTERFYRVDSGRSRALGGTGLGLAIVKHIVERHRGRFDIASVVGKGTTVTVQLPIAG